MIDKKRRNQTKKIIKKRIKQLKTFSPDFEHKEEKQPNRLAKKHAFGCRRSQCRICHPYKHKKSKK